MGDGKAVKKRIEATFTEGIQGHIQRPGKSEPKQQKAILKAVQVGPAQSPSNARFTITKT